MNTTSQFDLEKDLQRAERNYRDAKHEAKLEKESHWTELELLRKKLWHEKDLSNRHLNLFRREYPTYDDSGRHSPAGKIFLGWVTLLSYSTNVG